MGIVEYYSIGLLAAALFFKILNLSRKEKIHHFSHQHQLTLIEKDDDNVFCKGCEKPLSGFAYGCRNCEFYLHESCTEFPRELESFVHPCALILQKSSCFQCSVCEKVSASSFSYRCSWCNFELDVECALQSAAMAGEDEEQMQHFSHLHPLKLSEKTECEEISCDVCGKLCGGATYGCIECNFFLQKSCLDNLPQKIQHFYHSCPLVLLRISSYQCEICAENRSGLAFSCGKCGFHLDVECALFSKQIKHFLHEHPLTLREAEEGDEVCCTGCGESCSGPTYGCSRCKYYLHKSCAELEKNSKHCFHKCLLSLIISPPYQCDGCGENQVGLAYNCKDCDFFLDVECAMLPKIKSDGHSNKIQHFLHEHPLTLCTIEDDNEVLCNGCGERCLGLAYSCSRCTYCLHKSCAELPQKIKHFFHSCNHRRSLRLVMTSSYECQGCKAKGSGLAYRCVDCEFDLDVECAMLPTIETEGHKKIQHFSHGHPLIVSEKKDCDEILCKACGEICCLGLIYTCSICRDSYCLHESCANLLQNVEHEFHSDHSLNLLHKTFECKACGLHFRGFSYNCARCNFDLHTECASLIPSIKHEDDDHLLIFIKQMYGNPKCKACDSAFCGTSYLRCVVCDFSVHLLCAPLPQKIKHRCHIHPLTLKDEHVEDHSGEYYCDACEDVRDPKECVYYCEQCDFICHVGCVLSEVLPILRGERGIVELRRVNREIPISKLTRKHKSLNDILESLPEDDDTEFDLLTSAFDKEIEVIEEGLEKVTNENIDGILNFNLYSEKAFIKFLKALEFEPPEEFTVMTFWEPETEIVSVGNHNVPKEFVPVLEKLIDRYGNFTGESNLSSAHELRVLVLFLGAMYSMFKTKVAEVTGSLLYEWWTCCKFAEFVGFKVSFAFECLNRVAYARFALEYSELQEGTKLCKLHKKISKLSAAVEEQTKRLEELKEKQKQRVSSTRSARSSLSEENLTKALELRLKTASAALW